MCVCSPNRKQAPFIFSSRTFRTPVFNPGRCADCSAGLLCVWPPSTQDQCTGPLDKGLLQGGASSLPHDPAHLLSGWSLLQTADPVSLSVYTTQLRAVGPQHVPKGGTSSPCTNQASEEGSVKVRMANLWAASGRALPDRPRVRGVQIPTEAARGSCAEGLSACLKECKS